MRINKCGRVLRVRVRARVGVKLITMLCLVISFYSNSFAQDQYSLNPDFSYDRTETIEVYFFPSEEARWDGYEVLNKDWDSLDEYRKHKFVSEALKEIEEKEKVKVIFGGTEGDLVRLLDKTNKLLVSAGVKKPVITLLLQGLIAMQGISGEVVFSAENHPFLSKQILRKLSSINEDVPEVEIGKVYVGYIQCYKKDGEWLSSSEGPLIGEIKNRFFFAKRITVPSGTTMLSRNYPVNFEYKIIAFREINSFVDDNEIENFYYKVIFEPVREIF